MNTEVQKPDAAAALGAGLQHFPHLAMGDGDSGLSLFLDMWSLHLVLFPLTPRTAEWGDLIRESLATSCISPLG